MRRTHRSAISNWPFHESPAGRIGNSTRPSLPGIEAARGPGPQADQRFAGTTPAGHVPARSLRSGTNPPTQRQRRTQAQQLGPYAIESLINLSEEGRATVYRVSIGPHQQTSRISYHRGAEEYYFVLKGHATAVLDGQDYRLEAGDFLRLCRLAQPMGSLPGTSRWKCSMSTHLAAGQTVTPTLPMASPRRALPRMRRRISFDRYWCEDKGC